MTDNLIPRDEWKYKLDLGYQREIDKAELAALRAEHAQTKAELQRVQEERDDAQSLLASATDLLNSWARESYTTEAKTESDIKGVINRLWSYWSAEIARLREENEVLHRESKRVDDSHDKLEYELDRLRKTIEGMPCYLSHAPEQEHICYACRAVRALHPQELK